MDVPICTCLAVECTCHHIDDMWCDLCKRNFDRDCPWMFSKQRERNEARTSDSLRDALDRKFGRGYAP